MPKLDFSVAVITNLDRLYPKYDSEGKKLFFSLNLSTALQRDPNKALPQLDVAQVADLLLPFRWTNTTDVTIKAFASVITNTGVLRNSTPLTTATFRPYPELDKVNIPGSQALAFCKLADVYTPDLRAFFWDDTQVGNAGADTGEAFRNALGYFSTVAAPLPQALLLSLVFTVDKEELESIRTAVNVNEADEKFVLFAAAEFPKHVPTGSITNMVPPTFSVEPTTERKSDEIFTWDYEDVSFEGDTVAYRAYLNPARDPEKLLTVPDAPGETLSDLASLLVKGQATDRDWLAGVEARIGEVLALPQRIVDAARRQKATILEKATTRPEGAEPVTVSDSVYLPLWNALVGTARDVAGVGRFPGPDGESLVDAILARCEPFLPAGVSEDQATAIAQVERLALRAALTHFDKTTFAASTDVEKTVLENWKAFVKEATGLEIPDEAALKGLGISDFEDQLARWEAFASAISQEDNLRKLTLAQWDAAVAETVSLKLTASVDFYQDFDFRGVSPTAWRITLPRTSAVSFTLKITNIEADVPMLMVEVSPGADTEHRKVKVNGVDGATEFRVSPEGPFPFTISLGPWRAETHQTMTVQVSGSGEVAPILIQNVPIGAAPKKGLLTLNAGTDAFSSDLPIIAPVTVGDALGETPARSLWYGNRSKFLSSVSPNLQFGRRQALGVVGRLWAILVPPTMRANDTDDDFKLLRQNTQKGLHLYAAERLRTPVSIKRFTESFPTIPAATVYDTVMQAYPESGEEDFNSALLKNVLPESLPKDEDNQGPLPAAHPLVIRYANAGFAGATGNDKDDKEDIARRITGVVAFLGREETGKPGAIAPTCLNFAQIVFEKPIDIALIPVAHLFPDADGAAEKIFADLNGPALEKADRDKAKTRILALAEATNDIFDSVKNWQDYLKKAPLSGAPMFPDPLLPVLPGHTLLDRLMTLCPAKACSERQRRLFLWWQINQIIAEFLPSEIRQIELVKQAVVPSRMTYQSDFRQTFLTYNNAPLIVKNHQEKSAAKDSDVELQPTGDIAQTQVTPLLQYEQTLDAVPGLIHGLTYNFWLATPTPSGALPAEVSTATATTGHPAQLIKSNKDFTLPDDKRGTTVYRRRRPVGVPQRTTEKREALQDTQDKQGAKVTRLAHRRGLLPPVPNVKPLAEEFPAECATAEAPARFFYDEADEEVSFGRLELNIQPLWEILLPDIHDPLAPEGQEALRLVLVPDSEANLLSKKDKPTPSFEVPIILSKNEGRIAVQLGDSLARTDLLWPGFGVVFDLRITGKKAQDGSEYNITVAVRSDRGAWQRVPFKTAQTTRRLASEPYSLMVTTPAGREGALAVFRTPTAEYRKSTDAGGDSPAEDKVEALPPPAPPRAMERELIVLPHPNLVTPTLVKGNQGSFFVAPPTVDIDTFLRWQARERIDIATSNPQRAEELFYQQLYALSAYQLDANKVPDNKSPNKPDDVERTVDDPAVSFFVAELLPVSTLGLVDPTSARSERIRVPLPPLMAEINLVLENVGQPGERKTVELSETDNSLPALKHTPLKVVFTRALPTVAGDANARLDASVANILDVTVPAGAIYELRLSAAVAQKWFTDPSVARFPERLRHGLVSFEDDKTEEKKFFLLSPLVTVFETAPHVSTSDTDVKVPLLHNGLPDATTIWSALDVFRVGESLEVRYNRNSVPVAPMAGNILLSPKHPESETQLPYDPTLLRARSVFISSFDLQRQAWRWDGRPISTFPLPYLSNPELVGDAKQDTEETSLPLWDVVGFSDRSDADGVFVKTTLTATDPTPVLWERKEPPVRGIVPGHYYRFAGEARSRYHGLSSLFGTRFATRQTTAAPPVEGYVQADPWRRYFHATRNEAIPVVPNPRVKALIPLTRGIPPGNALNVAPEPPGFLIQLREPWFGVGGVTEDLDGEFVRVETEGGGRFLKQFGVDPLLTLRPDTEDQQTELDTDSPIGLTFDVNTDEALYLNASLIARPCLSGKRDKAFDWRLGRVIFRRRLEVGAPEAAVSHPLGPKLDPKPDLPLTLRPDVHAYTFTLEGMSADALETDATKVQLQLKGTEAGNSVAINTVRTTVAGKTFIQVKLGNSQPFVSLPDELTHGRKFDLRLVAVRRPDGATYKVHGFVRIPGRTPWLRLTTEADIIGTPMALGWDLPNLTATLTLAPITVPVLSPFTAPVWIQLLPDANGVYRQFSEPKKERERAEFGTYLLNVTASGKELKFEETPNGKRISLSYPAEETSRDARGRVFFDPYLAVTEVIYDARGRGNQERYVGLFRISRDPSGGEKTTIGLAYPMNPNLKLKSGANYRARFLEFQRRLDFLPRWEPTGATSSQAHIYFENMRLTPVGDTDAPDQWDLTLLSIKGSSGTLIFEVIIGDPEAKLSKMTITLAFANPGADGEPLSATTTISSEGTDVTVETREILSVPQGEGLDLRVRIARTTDKTGVLKWMLQPFFAQTIRGEWLVFPKESKRTRISTTLDPDDQPLVLAKVTWDGVGPVGTFSFLPPFLTAEGWEQLFPVEAEVSGSPFGTELSAEATDVAGRMIRVSPPINKESDNQA